MRVVMEEGEGVDGGRTAKVIQHKRLRVAEALLVKITSTRLSSQQTRFLGQ